MKRFNKITIVIMSFLLGLLSSSLLITNSVGWKYYLPLFLLVLLIRTAFNDVNENLVK